VIIACEHPGFWDTLPRNKSSALSQSKICDVCAEVAPANVGKAWTAYVQAPLT
jgi:hypothetical protein